MTLWGPEKRVKGAISSFFLLKQTRWKIRVFRALDCLLALVVGKVWPENHC